MRYPFSDFSVKVQKMFLKYNIYIIVEICGPTLGAYPRQAIMDDCRIRRNDIYPRITADTMVDLFNKIEDKIPAIVDSCNKSVTIIRDIYEEQYDFNEDKYHILEA